MSKEKHLPSTLTNEDKVSVKGKYIDAEAWLEELKIEYTEMWESNCLSELQSMQDNTKLQEAIMARPTADVVPKSEAENYRKIAEHQQTLAMDRYFEIKRLKEELAKAKSEVAKLIELHKEQRKRTMYRARKVTVEQIFGELEKLKGETWECGDVVEWADIIDLKKTYKICNGNCQECDKAIWETPISFVGDNRIVGCKWKESEDKP